MFFEETVRHNILLQHLPLSMKTENTKFQTNSEYIKLKYCRYDGAITLILIIF